MNDNKEKPENLFAEASGVLFCTLDDKMKERSLNYGGIIYFRSETDLREWRLSNKNSIWLNKVAQPNCKHCHGTGKLGTSYKELEASVMDIAKLINEHIDTTPEKLPSEMVKMLNISPEFEENLDMLFGIAQKQLTDKNKWDISEKFAGIIKQDFRMPNIHWCKCFTHNLKEQIKVIKRNIRFFVN